MGLRYIITPLLIFLLGWWIFRSVKEITTELNKEVPNSEFTEGTKVFIFVIIVSVIFLILIGFVKICGVIIKYW